MQSLPKKSLLPFTEEHEAFRREFGEFLDREIVPYYMDMEKNHSVGKETFKKFGDAGYGCLWLDKKYGGRELDMLYSIVYGEELNKRGLNGVLTRLSSDTVAPAGADVISSFGFFTSAFFSRHPTAKKNARERTDNTENNFFIFFLISFRSLKFQV